MRWRRRASVGGPLRIAFVTPNLGPGGAERQMLYLARSLPRPEFEVRFILLAEAGALAMEAEDAGIRVDLLGLPYEAGRRTSVASVRQIANAVRAYRRLTREVDIVDAWLVPAYTFAGLAGGVARVPVLLAGRRSSLDVPRTRTRLREWAGALAMRAVDAVVANSSAAAREAVDIEGIDPTKVHVIHNAVEAIDMSPGAVAAIRKAWGVARTDVVIGSVGNILPGKGHALLVQLASELRHPHPTLRWVFVGDGPLRAHVEQAIARLGLDGIVSVIPNEADARRLYGAFDICVQASDSEGLPNVVLEAAASQRAIVATNVGGTGEIIVDERDGLLVPHGDPAAMRSAIERLARDAGLRQRLADAAGRRALDFTVEKLVDRTGSLYMRLARGV